jgi:hypothetical protein
LWATLGDKYVQFDQLELAHNKAGNQVVLCPGNYQVRWADGHKREVVTRFRVESDELTVVELKGGADTATPIKEERKGIQWNSGR